MSIPTPNKLTLPFAENASGSYINNIPVGSQIATNPNGASYSDGFPPATMKAPSQGGLNPYGQDVNGVLKAITSVCRYYNAGGSFVYDSAFAADANVGGYPMGATILRADGAGFWFNEVAGNTTDPDSVSASGWYPGPTVGVTTVSLSNSNVALTYAQAGKDVIILSGALTANVNVILPAFVGMRWVVYNNTTGSFSATVKTASGSGVPVPTGYSMDLYCDGSNNIQSAITNVSTSTKWSTPRTVSLTGFTQGTMTLDGSGNVSMSTVSGSGFSNSKNANGYTYLPNGIIMQWGLLPITDDQYLTVTFPVSFPNAILNASATPRHVGAAGGETAVSAFVGGLTKTSMGIGCAVVSGVAVDGVYWTAVGY